MLLKSINSFTMNTICRQRVQLSITLLPKAYFLILSLDLFLNSFWSWPLLAPSPSWRDKSQWAVSTLLYIDEFMFKLCASGVGCFFANWYAGAVADADDIILLVRYATAEMDASCLWFTFQRVFYAFYNANKLDSFLKCKLFDTCRSSFYRRVLWNK